MLLLVTTTDKLQLVTGQAVTVDVHASYMDYNGTTVTPGRQNTAISTATTTDIVAAPSSGQRNVRTLVVRNKGASEVDVTVIYDQNGTDYVLHATALLAGSTLIYTEGVGFVQSVSPPDVLAGANVGDVTANAADTYLSSVALAVTGRLKAGTFLRYQFAMTKTAAGTATPIWSVRVGTAGSVADTARLTFTGTAQTAATDTGWAELAVTVRDAGASGLIQGNLTMEHIGTTTGLQNIAQIRIFQNLSSTFDLTVAGLILGVSINPGASGVWTFQLASVRAFNLAG